MADVTASIAGREASRGQLILVGGVVVAFGLLALVLLLNTALFAQNIATRGIGPGPDRAADHRALADDAADRVLRHEERIEYGTWAAAADNTTRTIGRVDATVRARHLQQYGAIARIGVSSLRRGAVLVQTESRNFTAGGVNVDADDWDLVRSTDGIRNFSMTVEANGTTSRSSRGNFTVEVEDADGDTWTAEVYTVGGAVEVRTGTTTCTSDAAVATINWTAGDFAGCSFPFAVDGAGTALDGPYDVRFRNGSNATGTYHVVVSDTDGDRVVESNLFAILSGDSPRRYVAVYAAVVDVRYEGATTAYETHLRAAPGEPEETSPAP